MFRFFFLSSLLVSSHALLKPQESETREIKSLDGVWNFRICPTLDPDLGFRQKWFAQPLTHGKEDEEVLQMPVPSSFNDITVDKKIRDFVGWAWYDRNFFVAQSWKGQRVVLRFGSAHYFSTVWVNGAKAMGHAGGHLPFEAEISHLLHYNAENRITVALNNTLTQHTIPQGQFEWKPESEHYPKSFFTLDYNFDFFNYAGIHRPVVLYTTPLNYIKDIALTTGFLSKDHKLANISFSIATQHSNNQTFWTRIQIFDQKGKQVGDFIGEKGQIGLSNPSLWWPHLMHPRPGYQYTVTVSMKGAEKGFFDVYRTKFGVRSLAWNSTGIYLNHRRLYLRGFGRHEDADIRGKGMDLPLIARDFNLIKWTGANAFRTSHYPYSEEVMDFADENGIMVINECPAVSLDNFDAQLLNNHKLTIQTMIQRDKNRASVIMWSVANEPRSSKPKAKDYFQNVVAFTKALDHTRPVTVVVNADVNSDLASDFVDIIGINRYFGWYSDTGHTELIRRQLNNDIHLWSKIKKKPVFIAEYGADTISGFHEVPSSTFTEEYQTELMMEYFKAFDDLKKVGVISGEMIWNFADFMTKQGVNRAWGNRKGIFTRQRQPKAAAHLLRRRYHYLAHQDSENQSDSRSYHCEL